MYYPLQSESGLTAGFDADAIASVTSIAEFIITNMTRQYQREELVEVITDTDPEFQQLVQGLIEIVREDCLGVLSK